MANQTLLAGLPLPRRNTHRIRSQDANADRAARKLQRMQAACERIDEEGSFHTDWIKLRRTSE